MKEPKTSPSVTNKRTFLLIAGCVCGLMYMMAFHNARSEKEELEHENEKLEMQIQMLKLELKNK